MSNDRPFYDDARTWFTPWRFVALLVVLIGAAYPEVVTLRETFFHRDFAAFGYPLAAWQRDCFWRGEIPLWNPLSYCGLPFIAEWNTLTLYPLSLIYLLFPLHWSLGIFCLVHFFIAGLGAYFLARRWTGHNLAATVAGIGFVFNALLLNSLMWPNNMAAFGWMPWIVLLVERAWREGGRLIVLAALAGAMQMLAGAPEVILLTWLVLLAMWLGQFWQQPPARKPMILRCIIVVALISGLAAAQLLPFLDLLKYSQRHTNFGDSKWSMPWWGWAHLLVPQFRTLPSPLGPRFQPEQAWVDTYYLGIGTVALGLFAAWRVRGMRARLIAVFAVLSLVLALGEKAWLYDVAKKVIPVFGFMRYPVKFVILTTFAFPLLAAFGVHQALTVPASEWIKVRARLFNLTAALLGIMTGIFWLDHWQTYKEIPWSVTGWSALSRALFLMLVIGAVVLLRHIAQPTTHRRLQVALPLLLWLDLMTFAPRPNPTAPLEVYEAGLAARELKLDPPPKVGLARAMLSYTAEVSLNANPLTNKVEYIYYNRLGLMGNNNLLDDFPKIGGAYSLYFRELENVLYRLYSQPTNPPAGLLDFLSVAQVTAEGRNIAWQARPTSLPWMTAGQQPVFAEPQTTLDALSATNFNPRQEVYLSPDARPLVSNTNSATVKLSAIQFGNQHISADFEASAPSILVINQNFYHRWQAFVNQQPAPLLRANHAFQAVAIPAGHGHVELVYDDPWFKIGLTAAALALALCGFFWFRPLKMSIDSAA